MRFATQLPGLVARLGDLVERDVESNVELHQEAIFSLPPIPFERVYPVIPAVVPMRTSFGIHFYIHVLNPAGGAGQVLCILGRGLWHLKITVSFTTNGDTDTSGELTTVDIGRSGSGLATVFGMGGFGANIIVRDNTQELILSEADDLTDIRMFVPTPTGGGSRTSLFCSVVGNKLL